MPRLSDLQHSPTLHPDQFCCKYNRVCVTCHAKLAMQGQVIPDEHVARLSPFIHRHINMLGRYAFMLPEEVQRDELRPLHDLALIDELEDL